jgi:xanthine/uracil permease
MAFVEFLRKRSATTFNLVVQVVLFIWVFTRYYLDRIPILWCVVGGVVVVTLAYVASSAVIYGAEKLWNQYSAKR